MHGGFVGIETDEAADRSVKRVLHETASITRRLREFGEEVLSAVVVAEDEMRLQTERAERNSECAVGELISRMREVARDDRKLGVGVEAVDAFDALSESLERIELVELLAWCDEMGVGDMNEFHVCATPGT